jgi:hypothetical protein
LARGALKVIVTVESEQATAADEQRHGRDRDERSGSPGND